MLEIISPAGFEQFFQDIDPFFPQGAEPELEKLLAAGERYGLELDLSSLPELIGRFGLTPPPEARPAGEQDQSPQPHTTKAKTANIIAPGSHPPTVTCLRAWWGQLPLARTRGVLGSQVHEQ